MPGVEGTVGRAISGALRRAWGQGTAAAAQGPTTPPAPTTEGGGSIMVRGQCVERNLFHARVNGMLVAPVVDRALRRIAYPHGEIRRRVSSVVKADSAPTAVVVVQVMSATKTLVLATLVRAPPLRHVVHGGNVILPAVPGPKRGQKYPGWEMVRTGQRALMEGNWWKIALMAHAP